MQLNEYQQELCTTSTWDFFTLFNASLEGNTRRAIDLREGEKLNEAAFRQLIRTAVEANAGVRAQRSAKKK